MTYYDSESRLFSAVRPNRHSFSGVRSVNGGAVLNSNRIGHIVQSTSDFNSSYPRMRSASESMVAAANGATGIGFIKGVNPVFLNACKDGDDNKIRQLMTSRTLTSEMVNCKDKTGKTGVNWICANANLHLLQLISSIPSLDINLDDNEGNSPLHFVSQAGHAEILHFLLNQFKELQIDARNSLGFTSLMKAALQGRTKCVKLLLAAGASPLLRDYGKGFCAYEWARYCSRQPCADVIEKFMRDCNCSPSTLRRQLKDLEKWNSEPNLQCYNIGNDNKDSWLKQKLKKALFNKQTNSSQKVHLSNYNVVSNITNVALCASLPVVSTASGIKNATSRVTNNNSKDVICSNNLNMCNLVPQVHVSEFTSGLTTNRS